jgi:hypothetical protein
MSSLLIVTKRVRAKRVAAMKATLSMMEMTAPPNIVP